MVVVPQLSMGSGRGGGGLCSDFVLRTNPYLSLFQSKTIPATEKGTADEEDDAIEELEGDIEELDGAIEELEDAMDDVIGGAVVEGASLLQYSSNALCKCKCTWCYLLIARISVHEWSGLPGHIKALYEPQIEHYA